jgi:hypothetical protein
MILKNFSLNVNYKNKQIPSTFSLVAQIDSLGFHLKICECENSVSYESFLFNNGKRIRASF